MPLAEGLETAIDLPHTISFAILYRERLNSFYDLPKEKRPPRNLWDKPYALSLFMDTLWDKDSEKSTTSSKYYEYDEGDVE